MTATFPDTTKALVFHGPHNLAWEDWPIAAPQPGEALIKIRAVGICGSDIHGYTGESGRRIPPMVMGHEAAGEVIDVGPDVSQAWIGRRVILQPFFACGTCPYCRTGRENLCAERRFLGANISGAMAEYLSIPVSNLIALPDSLAFETGTLAEPLSVAVHAVNRANRIKDCAVLIAGCGPIGLLTMTAAKRAGARKILMTDPLENRRALALQMGADAVLNPADENFQDTLKRGFDGSAADVAFDAVGITATFSQAVQSVKPGGVVIAMGGWQTVPINLGPVVAREINIHGSFNFSAAEFQMAADWLSNHVVNPAFFSIKKVPMQDGAAVFEALARREETGIKIVLTL